MAKYFDLENGERIDTYRIRDKKSSAIVFSKNRLTSANDFLRALDKVVDPLHSELEAANKRIAELEAALTMIADWADMRDRDSYILNGGFTPEKGSEPLMIIKDFRKIACIGLGRENPRKQAEADHASENENE